MDMSSPQSSAAVKSPYSYALPLPPRNSKTKMDNIFSYPVPTHDSPELATRAEPMQIKNILLVFLAQVKKNPLLSASLAKELKEEMKNHPNAGPEFLEAIALLEGETSSARQRIDEIDTLEKEWLEECVWMDSFPDLVEASPAGFQSAGDYLWAGANSAVNMVKVSGEMVYFLCDRVLLNDKLLRILAAVGGAASILNLAANPCLPVITVITKFVLPKIIR